MDIFEEELEQEKKKRMKTIKTSIIISMIILVVVAIVIAVISLNMESKKLKVVKDRVQIAADTEVFYIKENGKVYINIEKYAKTVNNNYQKGDLTDQDDKKGCVLKEEENTFFEANSKKVIKVVDEKENSSEYYYIDEPVIYENGVLYTTLEGIGLIFNNVISYDQTKNMIEIYTLEYLETLYTGQLANWGYKELVDTYIDRRSLVDGYVIAETEDKSVGIRKTDGTELVGAKYKEIEYVRTTEEFFMTNEQGQKGLITKQGKTKIKCEYSDIEVLDKDLGLYLVTKDKKKGVINKDNNKVIYIEYDEIGIDKSKFTGNEIQNPYLFYNNCIPVCKEKKWGLIDKNGKEVIGLNYDEIGCISSTNSSDKNVLLIPEYEAIVMKQGDYYGIYNSLGKELIPCALTDITQTVVSGKTVYEMTYREEKLNLEEYFKAHGISKVTNSTSDVTSNAGEEIEIKNEES